MKNEFLVVVKAANQERIIIATAPDPRKLPLAAGRLVALEIKRWNGDTATMIGVCTTPTMEADPLAIYAALTRKPNQIRTDELRPEDILPEGVDPRLIQDPEQRPRIKAVFTATDVAWAFSPETKKPEDVQ